jgi:hypothetical protein
MIDDYRKTKPMKLMRTHHPVAILHVAAVEFVCHILKR